MSPFATPTDILSSNSSDEEDEALLRSLSAVKLGSQEGIQQHTDDASSCTGSLSSSSSSACSVAVPSVRFDLTCNEVHEVTSRHDWTAKEQSSLWLNKSDYARAKNRVVRALTKFHQGDGFVTLDPSLEMYATSTRVGRSREMRRSKIRQVVLREQERLVRNSSRKTRRYSKDRMAEDLRRVSIRTSRACRDSALKRAHTVEEELLDDLVVSRIQQECYDAMATLRQEEDDGISTCSSSSETISGILLSEESMQLPAWQFCKILLDL